MNTYEKLQDEACKDGIDVVDYPFENFHCFVDY